MDATATDHHHHRHHHHHHHHHHHRDHHDSVGSNTSSTEQPPAAVAIVMDSPAETSTEVDEECLRLPVVVVDREKNEEETQVMSAATEAVPDDWEPPSENSVQQVV